MPLDPELSYLHCVVMEIIETERIYVHDLHSIVEGYLTHIIDNAGLPIIPEQVCSLFGNIEDIYEFNSELLQELDLCNNDPVAIGRCFVLKSDYFEIYTQYCTNYPNSVAALTECMRNKTLLKFFMDRQEALKHPLPLGSYLLKPVQRILKYHLLLQEIAKHFDPDEEGYEVVEEAINTMTEVAWYINTMKRKHEHAVRLQEVQSLLVDWRGPDLTTYGELVLEGTFRFHHAKNNRTLFLLERVLLITKRRGENFIYKTHISCSTLMLMEGTKDSLCFSVTHYKHPKQPHTVQAKTMEEKKLWTHHIKRLIIENYHTIIPQKAKQVILEMDPVHEKYRFNSEKKKKSQSNDFTHTHQSAAAGPKDEEWHGHRHIRPSQQVEVQDRPNTKKTSPHTLQFKNSTEVRPAQEIKPESDFEGVQIRHGEDDVSIMERSARGEVRDDSIQNQDGPSSEEETEENCAGSKDHSIQSFNAHRSGAAPDDFIVNVYCSGAAPDELQSPRRIQLGVTSNKNLTPQFPRETVSESGKRVCRRGDSSLSKREQLLIGKVRNYYEKAEQLDEGFGLRRRESLTYIPRGLVHTSVSHFNQIPHTKPPNTQTLLVTSSTTSHISTSVDRVRDELGSEGTDPKSRTSEEFRSSAEMIRVWQEMEKKFTSSPRETRLRNASQFKGTGSVLQRFSTNGDEGDAKCIEDLSSITEEPTVQAKGDEDDSGGNSVLIIKKKFCEHTHVKETPARRQHSETSIDTTLQINPPSVLHEKKTLRGSPKLASCDQTRTPSSSCSPLPILPTQHSQCKSTAPTEGFSWPDVSELRSIYTSLEFSRLNSAVKTLAPGCGAQNKSAVQRSDCLNQNRAGLVWTEVQNKKWSSNYIISAQTALPNNTTISVLEKVNNTPLEASQHHVPVQSLSPWENLLSVTDRCRAYGHPDKLAFRAQPQPKDNNNKTDKHLETTQQQGVVRNLREKFLNPT